MMIQSIVETVHEKLVALGVERGDHILLAFSGGPDSFALLDILRDLEGKAFIGLTAAHLDHAVRGKASEADALHVRTLCREGGVPLVLHRLSALEVEKERRKQRSLEGAMRVLRYSFLEGAAEEAGARWIATAHHSDDQVETVLFRVRRGMDWRSLTGIPERKGTVIRPMLALTRKEIRDYCRRKGLEPLEDATNKDLRFARNRIRHLVIPALRGCFHSDIDPLVLRLAAAAGALERVEARILEVLFPDLDSKDGEGGLRRDALGRIPAALREGVVQRYLRTMISSHAKATLIRDVTDMLVEEGDGRVRIPGGRELVINSQGVLPVSGEQPPAPFVMERNWPVPGRIEVSELGFSLTAEIKVYDGISAFPRGRSCMVRKNAVRAPLVVRTRRPGDRIRVLGMEDTKSLKRYFIDRKVPREERDRIPLVLDATGEIIWIPGYDVSEKVRLRQGVSEDAYLFKMGKLKNGE